MKKVEGGNLVARQLVRMPYPRPVRANAPRCDLLEKVVQRHGQHITSHGSEPPVKSGQRRRVFNTKQLPEA